MVVVCQDLFDPAVEANVHRNAVREAIAFVAARFIKLKPFKKTFLL